jgi:hypothetical protein
MVAGSATLTRAADNLTQQTILLAARIALRIYSMDPGVLAIDLWGLIEDESLSDPRSGYRLTQCVSLITGGTTPADPRTAQWHREFAYGAVMAALHTLVNYRLSVRTAYHS